jgi:hypothetical protein
VINPIERMLHCVQNFSDSPISAFFDQHEEHTEEEEERYVSTRHYRVYCRVYYHISASHYRSYVVHCSCKQRMSLFLPLLSRSTSTTSPDFFSPMLLGWLLQSRVEEAVGAAVDQGGVGGRTHTKGI